MGEKGETDGKKGWVGKETIEESEISRDRASKKRVENAFLNDFLFVVTVYMGTAYFLWLKIAKLP